MHRWTYKKKKNSRDQRKTTEEWNFTGLGSYLQHSTSHWSLTSRRSNTSYILEPMLIIELQAKHMQTLSERSSLNLGEKNHYLYISAESKLILTLQQKISWKYYFWNNTLYWVAVLSVTVFSVITPSEQAVFADVTFLSKLHSLFIFLTVHT